MAPVNNYYYSCIPPLLSKPDKRKATPEGQTRPKKSGLAEIEKLLISKKNSRATQNCRQQGTQTCQTACG
jgi:hypothetical protein